MMITNTCIRLYVYLYTQSIIFTQSIIAHIVILKIKKNNM